MPYLDTIGYQKTDTSKDAAIAVKAKAPILREMVFDAIKSYGPISTENIARVIERPEASVQPRTSELKNAKRIVDSGIRSLTKWGKSCILWKAE